MGASEQPEGEHLLASPFSRWLCLQLLLRIPFLTWRELRHLLQVKAGPFFAHLTARDPWGSFETDPTAVTSYLFL